MTTVITRGAGSAQALGYAARATAANYIEDVFSTYLYTGTAASQTITNGVDLSTKGGMVWLKVRSGTTGDHEIFDTARGTTKRLMTNSTSSELTNANTLTAFNSNGFSIGNYSEINGSGNGMASWTFRKQAKFFDVVTYTGNGSASRAINHNLGSVPGCIIVKCTSSATNWPVYHRGLNNGVNPQDYAIYLNLTNDGTGGGRWAGLAPTSTQFYVNNDGTVNTNGETYVAYLFAHDAGGFGASGSDNVISCGSFTTDGSGNATVSLGYEPQWLLIKHSNGTGNWSIIDNMRGLTSETGGDGILNPNSSAAEASYATDYIGPTSTGFYTKGFYGPSTQTIIYIAIRRGPMRTPTSGTSVYTPTVFTAADTFQTANFPVDLAIEGQDISSLTYWYWMDRLRGARTLQPSSTGAEFAESGTSFASNTQVRVSDQGNSYRRSYQMFRRAPGFFDEVCYTGNGTANRAISHNLGVAPEIVLIKSRVTGGNWRYYYNFTSTTQDSMFLNLNNSSSTDTYTSLGNARPTSSFFYVGSSSTWNSSSDNYVAYLFASCPGVSKVGSYTGTGTTLQVNCGFTGGARFVLIKRTDSTGDWYVWDSARGIVAGNDPYLLLNSTAAEVTNTDYVDTYSAGFEISSTAPAAINANGGTFIFLAIA